MNGDLSGAELQRYARHLILDGVGLEGQRRLRDARILLVGAGGLGSPAALYLAAAGVGTLGIADPDVVDVTNLQRQVLHGESDVGRPKLDSARDRLREVNPHVHVEPFPVRLTAANALDIMRGFDVVVDGTDNFATRYLTSDACVLLGIPNVYGSVLRFEGQVSVFAAPGAPCYRCLFPEPPPPDSVPGCAEAGVLGVLPGLIGTIQATEAVKLVLGIGETLAGRLLLVDAMTMEFRTMRLRQDPACPACGTREIRELIDYDAFCAGPVHDTGANGMTAGPEQMGEITPAELSARLASGEDVQLIDVREPHELRIASIPQARLIPQGQLEAQMDTLDRDREVILMCRSGARSANAARMLLRHGFRATNLVGGILRWSDEVDPTVRKY